MPNNLATLSGTLIAARILELLLEEHPVLRLITTDFSGESALFNQPIKIQTPGAVAADNYSTSTGYDAQSVTQTEVTLTIDKHKHVTYGFNDQERSSTATELIERFALNAAHALGGAFVADLMALVVASNFPNFTHIPPDSFDRRDVIGIGKTLNGRKLPAAGRFSLLNSDYYAQLLGDTEIVANPGSPSAAVKSGELDNVHGFAVREYTQLPENAENLQGFAGTRDALVLATRVPEMPRAESLSGGSIRNVTEPNTGLSIQLRTWYDMKLGKEFRTYTVMYGVAAGNAASIQRIRNVP